LLFLISTCFKELVRLSKLRLCDGRRERWYRALALRFSAIRMRMCSGIEMELFENCVCIGVACQAAD